MANYVGTLQDANSNNLYPKGMTLVDITNQFTKGTSTAVSNADAVLRANYDPVNKIVEGSFYMFSTSDIQSSNVLYTVASAYRPGSNVAFPAFMLAGTTIRPYYITLTSTGNITQNLGNTTRAIYCYFKYQI